MSVIPLRPLQHFAPDLSVPGQNAYPGVTLAGLAWDIAQSGVIPLHAVLAELALHRQGQQHLLDLLQSKHRLSGDRLYHHVALYWGVGAVDLAQHGPDPALFDRIGPVRALRDGVMPWRKIGAATVIVTAYPDRFESLIPQLKQEFGKVLMAVAPLQAIQAAVLKVAGKQLAHCAENRVAAHESCRNLQSRTLRQPAFALAAAAMIVCSLWPLAALCGLTLLALLAVISFALLKIAALTTLARRCPPNASPPIIARLPMVSIMVALYRESDIAARLTQRLGKLDYPRDKLEVLLVVEAEDQMTRLALAHSELPPWMRVVVVPEGTVKTKPRALNYALDHCRGVIVGIYDAEDQPAPDQLHKVVQRFHECPPDVVCLQGILDFYNPRTNWLARCFTIEYASWFRAFLPGIERLGLAVPLGGTTLFFRRSVLEQLGGWDAQNVTEDADLGLRLARHGYRTELIDTVTFEEANCRALPWAKQRSRWIKGYMMTWLSHMRDPVLFWRQLGSRRFIGFQILFLGSLLQALLAPLLWSCWLIPLGFWHPLPQVLPHAGFVALYVSMIAVQALTIGFDLIGLRRTQHRLNPLWVPTLLIYHMMATAAAYKALWELLTRPFYWDKTSHGHFDT